MSQPPAPIDTVHLDAVGGIAGDMFASALIDSRPELEAPVRESVATLGFEAAIALEPFHDGAFTGKRFTVGTDAPHEHGQHDDDHDHVRMATIRGRLDHAPLGVAVRAHALGIFEVLARAEAEVHGIDPQDVAFHEVGAADSIIDIVAAAAIIDAIGARRWTVGALPRGRGLVASRHGFLPVPAPAVSILLEGMTLIDDGEDGERVTPTGAAILRYLEASQEADARPLILAATGYGFGQKRLRDRGNYLRATLYQHSSVAAVDPMRGDEVALLRFEIDDQLPEDLAVGLDRLRAHHGVIDICQWSVTGKKGRVAQAIQILARVDAVEPVCEAVFLETTTLGIRYAPVARRVLRREFADGGDLEVKIAMRPDGASAKAEIDDVAAIAGARQRMQRRIEAENAALKRRGERS